MVYSRAQTYSMLLFASAIVRLSEYKLYVRLLKKEIQENGNFALYFMGFKGFVLVCMTG